MPRIELITIINADLKTCFDLSRDIDFHKSSLQHTNEKVIAGVSSGLIGMGETVTWSARHFGLWLSLTSEITAFDRPNHFRDSMKNGPFKRFDHDHYFKSNGSETLMTDVFDYESPLWILGQVADRLFLIKYMTQLLQTRNEALKIAAEDKSKGQ